MSVSPFDSGIYAGLFSDPDVTRLFSDEAEIDTMVEVEVALAKVQGDLGIIPADAATEIAKTAETFTPDIQNIAENAAVSGLPTIAFINQFKTAVGDAGNYVHWGATSQDIIDTGLILRLRQAIEIIGKRITATSDILSAMADEHRATMMIGRTRSQQAVPTTFGLKVAGWLDALIDAEDGLRDTLPRLLRVQFGGAAGNLSALGDQGLLVADGLARELGLQSAPSPWHTNRAALVNYAAQLSVITNVLGKIGQDIVLLCQSEVSELRLGSSGGSSTMPQKANPVAAETLVTLARFNAGLLGTMAQAQIQEHERGGPGWQLEWLTLPQIVSACSGALHQAEMLLGGLTVNSKRMFENLNASNGLVLAEAASFALAEHMPKSAAQKLVKEAIRDSLQSSAGFIDILKERTPASVGWDTVADASTNLGVSDGLITRVLNRRHK